jgi:putative N6-adenine-specific DNA methylase
MPPDPFNTYAITAPGLETLLAGELRALDIQSDNDPAHAEPGGISFSATLEDLYRLNLHLRTANRVIVRLGSFNAAAFSELRKKASRLEWERFLVPGRPVEISAASHKSHLYHTGGIAERVLGAIADRLGQPSHQPDPDRKEREVQLVLVRIVSDRCTISIDTSGELLHRRGYRLATAKAPLRETLAAAMLLASGWDPAAPLLDPLCGSGTIPIEAAMLRLGIPPGRHRDFAFMHWPGFDPHLWQSILDRAAPADPTGDLPPIQGSDRDAGAIQIAQANAERAGVSGAIELTQRAVSAIDPPPGPGWVIANPPYGLRVSPTKDLRNLYAQLGNVLRRRCPGWQAAILSSDPRLLAQTGLQLETVFTTLNGGVSVRLAVGRI